MESRRSNDLSGDNTLKENITPTFNSPGFTSVTATSHPRIGGLRLQTQAPSLPSDPHPIQSSLPTSLTRANPCSSPTTTSSPVLGPHVHQPRTTAFELSASRAESDRVPPTPASAPTWPPHLMIDLDGRIDPRSELLPDLGNCGTSGDVGNGRNSRCAKALCPDLQLVIELAIPPCLTCGSKPSFFSSHNASGSRITLKICTPQASALVNPVQPQTQPHPASTLKRKTSPSRSVGGAHSTANDTELDNDDRSDLPPLSKRSKPSSTPSTKPTGISKGKRAKESDGAGAQPRLIPRPPGEHGKGGWNLQVHVGLENDQDTWSNLRRCVRKAVYESRLNIWLRITCQDQTSLLKCYTLVKRQYPFMDQFEDDWATRELVKSVCQNARTYCRRKGLSKSNPSQALELLKAGDSEDEDGQDADEGRLDEGEDDDTGSDDG